MNKNLKLSSIMNIMREKKKAFIIAIIVLILTGVAGTFAFLDNTKATIKDGWYTEDVAPQYYKNGELQKGLLEVDGDWFYFGNDGFMKTGFVEIDGKTYYFDNKGKMVIGFIEIGDSTYYFDKSGVMATGKVEINGVEYDFGTDGKLILDNGDEIEVTEDDEGNQTVVVKNKDGKEVSKVTVNESKPENVSVSQGSTGKETSTPSNSGGSSNNGGNSSSSSTSSGSGSGSSNNGSSSGGSSSNSGGSSNNGGNSSGGSTSSGSGSGSSNNGSGSGGSSSNSGGSSNNGGNSSGGSTSSGSGSGSSNNGSGSGGSSSNSGGSSNNGGNSSGGSTEEKPDTSHWWDGMSVSQIREKVTGGMVWKNEITGQTYKGVDGLSFAWNQEDIVYGGLKLISNPYNVDLPYSFPGGRGGMISTDTFEMFWNLPEGTYNGMKGINLGTFTIKKPQAISADEVTKLYQ